MDTASIMILSHSRLVAEGAKELAREMNKDIEIYAVGGAKDGATGSDYDAARESLQEAIGHGSVIVLFDLGSTLMTIQMILDDLSEDERSRVFLSDAALVEGAIVASVTLGAGVPPEEVMEELKKISLNKIPE